VTPSRSVLVIDGSADTDAVLRAVLEPRGARVRRTRSHRVAAESSRPDVVVIDLDEGSADRHAFGATPRVLIGSQRVTVRQPHDRFLEKPFQFPELIRAVEELLATAAPAA
jgi:CheY-like chemotaxis protein